MTSLLHVARGEKEAPEQIKPEWLGAEARTHISPHRLAGNRLMLRTRRLRIAGMLFSLCAGIAMGSLLTLFARGQFGSRYSRRISKRGEPFRVSGEVAPCLDY